WQLNFDLDTLHHLLRKSAHFLVYLVLGILLYRALCLSGISGIGGMVLAFLLGFFYAISDEVHQIFVPGRSGEIGDVLLDSAGVLIGVWLFAFRKKSG